MQDISPKILSLLRRGGLSMVRSYRLGPEDEWTPSWKYELPHVEKSSAVGTGNPNQRPDTMSCRCVDVLVTFASQPPASFSRSEVVPPCTKPYTMIMLFLVMTKAGLAVSLLSIQCERRYVLLYRSSFDI